MRHPDLSPDQGALAVSIAQKAVRLARGASTARPGTLFIPNGDGTGTLIGPGSASVGIAEWVGDTEPPGRPTGITCKTSWGALYVEWDGTLEGGVPSDFSHVSVLVDDAEIGQMTGPGTLVQSGYADGETLRVTAIAYDSARDTLGNPAPNASGAFGPVEVAISDERAEIDADVAEIKKKADQASEDAAAASGKADALQGEVSDVKTTVEGVEAGLDGLTAKVEGAASSADEALTAATEAKQTATEVRTTAERAYENAEEAIRQSSTAVQTATEVKTTLETDYQTKNDADASYASKSELSQTSESIKSEVSKMYATKSSVDELQNIADNAIESWTGAVVPTASNEPASDWTTPERKKRHSGDLYYNTTTGYSYRWGSTDGANYSWSIVKDTDITKALADAAAAQSTANNATSKADAAQSSADAAQSGVDKLNVDIPATYATKSSVEQTAESIRSEVGKTYQPKGDYATNAQLGSFAEKSYVDQKAGDITSAVESTYVSKTDASKTFATKTEVKQEADSIKSTVGEVRSTADSAFEKASTVEQTAGGITIRLDQTVKNVAAAQSTANTANTAAGKAQTAANNAVTAASNAQSTANAAKTAAANAQIAAGNAAKTATNYLKFDSSGLVVGNHAGTLQGNTLIDAGGVSVRKGSTVLARFASDVVEIARAARTGTISMLAGLLTIEGAKSKSSGVFTIRARKDASDATSPKIGIIADGAYDAELTVAATDSSLDDDIPNLGMVILRAAVISTPKGDISVADLYEAVGGWERSY